MLYPLPTFLSATNPIKQPPSLASRFVARPLWWAVSKVNPFGGSGEEVVETEERSWKRVAKTEWVHLELVEVNARICPLGEILGSGYSY